MSQESGTPITFVQMWRRNLRLRLVSITLVISLGILGVVGVLLLTRVTNGLLEAKQRSSLSEATAARSEVQRLLNASDTGLAAPNVTRLIDSAITALAVRSGSPGIYDALILADPQLFGVPERGTKLVDVNSVPSILRDAVAQRDRQAWAYGKIRYDDGTVEPGIIVGAPVTVPRVGAYELYLLFPLTGEQQTIDLLKRGVAATGVTLLFSLGLIAWFITSRVTDPIREAAEVAEQLASGDLDRRMEIRGVDDLATLAGSFNAMAESLQEQIVTLETLSLVQQQFVSDVSHELRTPLTTVRMASEMIYDSRADFDPDTARAAELLRNQVDRFDLLLGDLLEISRVDAGVALLEKTTIDVCSLVTMLIEEYEPIATQQKTPITLHLPDYPILLDADPRRISRIVRNFVVNAIEHGAEKPIDVTVRANTNNVSIGVRDHGQGMTMAEQDRVFDRFWRADPSRKRTMGGTGLGLAISFDDARLHGGRIDVWGKPHHGAHFVVIIPIQADSHIGLPAISVVPRDV